jgi:hypothetical protein
MMNKTMKTAISIFGILLILVGALWILQGINILPGSVMSGDPQWAINGGIAAIIGAGLLWFANRKK